MIIQDDSDEDGDYYENDKKYLLNRIHDTDEANKSKKKKEHTEDASGKEGNQANRSPLDQLAHQQNQSVIYFPNCLY